MSRTTPCEPAISTDSLNPTTAAARSELLDREVEGVLARARDEVFEDGVQSRLSRDLSDFIDRTGALGVAALAHRIQVHNAGRDEHAAAEALRCIGRSTDARTHHVRLSLLEECLFDESMLLRDAAMLGLESLGEAHAAPYLRQAAEREQYGPLKREMLDLAGELIGGETH